MCFTTRFVFSLVRSKWFGKVKHDKEIAQGLSTTQSPRMHQKHFIRSGIACTHIFFTADWLNKLFIKVSIYQCKTVHSTWYQGVIDSQVKCRTKSNADHKYNLYLPQLLNFNIYTLTSQFVHQPFWLLFQLRCLTIQNIERHVRLACNHCYKQTRPILLCRNVPPGCWNTTELLWLNTKVNHIFTL